METPTLWRSFAIGLTVGLRSMTGPAVAMWRVRDPLRLAIAALALGELIADKLPATPARTIPPALVFRLISGAFCGRLVAARLDLDRLSGAIVGAAGALTGAYLGQGVRGSIVRESGIPDPVVATVEDVLAIYGALGASRGVA